MYVLLTCLVPVRCGVYCRMRQREREDEERREEDRIEAIEVRRQAAEFEEELRRKAEVRRQRAVKQAEDNKRQIEDVEMTKQIDRIQQEVVIHFCCSVIILTFTL